MGVVNTSMLKEEVSKFTSIASKWWDYSGPFKMLHEINPIRIEYILSKIEKYHIKEQKYPAISDLKILDVGCGGGIVSIPLARLGAKVTGIDAGAENINEAKNKANEDTSLEINFENIAVEDFNKRDQTFDIVICLEVLEHVANPKNFIVELSKLVKKNGILIVSTINRNLKSKLLAVGIAEYVMRIIPKGTHDPKKFLKPSELEKYGSIANLEMVDLTGMSFNLFKQKWEISKDIDINFFCTFVKRYD